VLIKNLTPGVLGIVKWLGPIPIPWRRSALGPNQHDPPSSSRGRQLVSDLGHPCVFRFRIALQAGNIPYCFSWNAISPIAVRFHQNFYPARELLFRPRPQRYRSCEGEKCLVRSSKSFIIITIQLRFPSFFNGNRSRVDYSEFKIFTTD